MQTAPCEPLQGEEVPVLGDLIKSVKRKNCYQPGQAAAQHQNLACAVFDLIGACLGPWLALAFLSSRRDG